jgi:small subunit ribosomal protein S3
MGHKVHPTGFRIGVIRGWQGKWYADRHYANYLEEDLKVRRAIETKYPEAAISSVEIERQANQVVATINTARPGIVIGRGGQRVDEARVYLEKIIGKRIQLNIKEVQQPELDARLVARSIADQLERRIAYRRAMKQAMARTMQAGGKGIKVAVAGRLGGAEIARGLNMHEGRVPLHTLRADIDYGFVEAKTVMGRIGVKTWIYKGEILPEMKTEEVETAPEPVVVAEVARPAAAAAVAAVAVAEVKPVAAAPVVEARVEPATSPAVEAVVVPVAEAPVAEGDKAPARPRRRTAIRKVTPKAEGGEPTAADAPAASGDDHAAT